MIRLFLTVVLTALLAISEAAADALPVTLVTDDNHFPYAFLDQGKPAGIYVRIVETIAARMPGYRITVTALPWKRALRLTETGEVSGIFPPHQFPLERPYLDRYSDPILSETPVLQCNDTTLATHGIDRRKAIWPNGYAGMTIAAPNGTHMGGDRLWRLFPVNGIKVIASGGIMENMRELAYGRVDCLLNDRLTVRTATAWLQKNDPTVPLVALAEAMAFPVEDGYLALSGPAAIHEPFHEAFIAEFNAGLKRLRTEGALDALVENYLRELTS
jgi:polar amino acid transport system substrate-binding protein